MGIEFRALGPLEVQVDGRLVGLAGPKQRALLGVLLLHANAAVSTDRLVEEMWGDHPPTAPGRNIQVYVSSIRAALGPYAETLRRAGGGYRVDVAEQEFDVRRFERAAADAKGLLANGDVTRAAAAAAAGLALWRGPAYADVADAEAARTEIARLEALRLDLVEDRIEAELALGRHREVVVELPGLVDSYPLRERLRRQLMLALHRCGRRADALAVYRAGRRHVVDELGLEPGAELRDLHEAILRDDPRLLVEPAELRARRHLPAPATSLIGRRAEIAEITAMLRDPSVRLVTLTGPGGIGKTRLALRAAHELADAFADGVFFVGLAGLTDPGLVDSTVAAALEVEERGDQRLLGTLQDHLRRRRMLILLDNFEHLDEAAPLVSEVLSAAPELKVLVTSRSPLQLYGEHEYPVSQLALVDEAVPLFTARAKAVDRTFGLAAPVADVVAEICLQLDCLPLAIELVAARSRELAPQDMLAMLSRRLELAVAGPRDLPARQRTLRAAIDWSYRLLSRGEQQLFARLAVFSGGCTPDAVRAICGDTATHLPSLVGKNLVMERPAEPVGTRVDMLETIREYALDCLDAPPTAGQDHGGGGIPARDEHARYFVALAETAEDELRGAEQLDWIARLNAERDNIRSALGHLLSDAPPEHSPRPVLALRLVAALGYFWYKTGSASEGSAWLRRALAAAPTGPDRLRARALHALGILVADQGETAAALAHFEESGALFRAEGDLAGVARSLNSQGGIARDLGDVVRAERMFAESADLRRRLGDPRSLAIVLGNLAMVALDRQDPAHARMLAEESLELTRGADEWLYAASLMLLADASVELSDTSAASALLRQAVRLLHQLGDTSRLIECLDSCAALAAATDKPAVAARLVGAADAALENFGARIVTADSRLRERRLRAARTTLGEDTFEAARREGRTMALEPALDYALAEAVGANGTLSEGQ